MPKTTTCSELAIEDRIGGHHHSRVAGVRKEQPYAAATALTERLAVVEDRQCHLRLRARGSSSEGD
jgi:hypothetical protein